MPRQAGQIPVALIVVIAIVVLFGILAFFYLSKPPEQQEPPPLSPEAKAYVQYLELTDVAMKASESYLGATLVEITGNITNRGDRTVQYAAVTCVFRDPYGQVVLREVVPIIRRRTGGLKPGETKPFRMAFDTIPESWNGQMPQLVIAQLEFGE